MKLAILILAVDDLARAVAFYTTAFECARAVTSPNYVELELGGSVRLGLYEKHGFARNLGLVPEDPIGTVTRTELYVRVEDLHTAVGKLHAAGGRLLSAAQPRSWGEVVAYLADPDGNVIAVAGVDDHVVPSQHG